ncbi:MAG TPA: NAD(P)/FAD-dependent oxidoreductase [Granulicella sp.]|jgi:predicted Rossmann fold flavoprotein|nr:NAD(P)/FAD-dependent oxidoreductase [Granulicella sp.]
MSRSTSHNPGHFDVIILGAGAAGLMCAATAGRRGRRVLLLDHAERIGKKILISGGGRANFTNLHCRAENFLSENPHFAKSALAAFTPSDMIALVEKHRIPYHEKTLGQLFCDRSAQDLVQLLARECAEAGVEIRTGTRILAVSKPDRFRVDTESAAGPASFTADSLIIATGGLSIPKMGATALGYEIATQFGLDLVPCRPALVPFVFNPQDTERWCDLSGLSAEVIASAAPSPRRGNGNGNSRRNLQPSFREKLLITHRGLSGPAILQISSYWRPGEEIILDLAPARELTATLLQPNARRDLGAALAALRTLLPARLAERWLELHPPAAWTNPALARFEDSLHTWRLNPAGTEGYAKAEVTAGGVSTAELDAKTMQSRKLPGLFLIGEVVDVTGWLGGYNFQWAWSSATQAGNAV